jgi:gliding motility-associated lipoprotein GldH
MLLSIIVTHFTACKSAVFSKRHSFSDNTWHAKDSVAFQPEIKEVSKSYEIILNLRHTQHYACKNIIFSMSISAPDGKMLSYELLDMPLADNSGMWSGEWLGDIVDQKLILKRNYTFPQAGKYTFRFAQQMRDKEKLRSIMTVGLEIKEKS